MAKYSVRLTDLTIKDFKNVKTGQLNFVNSKCQYKTSILGLYGQNGSGKTTVIDALLLLQYALSGKAVPNNFADYINVDAEFSSLKYTFSVNTETERFEVDYEFNLGKEIDEDDQDSEYAFVLEKKYKAKIFNEIISYSYDSGSERIRKSKLIDTRSSKVFIPDKKYESLFGKDRETETMLTVTKGIAVQCSKSFVFSKDFFNILRKQDLKDIEAKRHLSLLETLRHYGNYELFVITTRNNGIISMNVLPFIFRYGNENVNIIGNFPLQLNGTTTVSPEIEAIVKHIIDNMNIVLSEIVPNLKISIKNLGTEVLKDGSVGNRIQLMSNKNNKDIPLKYESEGIKKIISVLSLLIAVYNQDSVTVAIDELDSGIFEYLLGELMKIISEKGKGQLIFTSHNLRPLETIDRGFTAFTTTNPNNRYIKLSKVKDNNNLRDFYYRDIILGIQKEDVYNQTNNSEIALAFRRAGGISG